MSTTNWAFSNSVVVGAACPLEIDAEFSVGRAVFQPADGTPHVLLQRSMSPDGTTLGGDILSLEEWHALKEAEEAQSIEPTVVAHPVVAWVFRSGKRDHWWKSHIQQLQQLGALAYQETPQKIRSSRICLVHTNRVGTARDLWSHSSSEDAWRALISGARADALRHARRAFCLAPRLQERDVAMLVVTYSQAGKHEDSEGVLAMAKRSKGEIFFQTVLGRRERLLEDLQASLARPVGPQSRVARSRSAFDRVAIAGLREWSQNHEAPST